MGKRLLLALILMSACGCKKEPPRYKRHLMPGDELELTSRQMNLLVDDNIIEQKEAEELLKECKLVGGFTINGYNLIYLNAEILNVLIRKNLVSLKEAQAMLDDALVNP